MSFRLFMYYCALCGGGGAFVGWMVGRFLTWVIVDGHEAMDAAVREALEASLKGMALGMVVALALSLVDALWVFSLRQFVAIAGRVLTAVVVGGLSGLFGGLVSDLLYFFTGWEFFKVVGYTITGLLIGVSLGMFDLIVSVMKGQDSRGAQKKLINGVVGGGLGGIIGGILAVLLQIVWTQLFASKPPKFLWSPSAWGFVVLGACIGLLISLAQADRQQRGTDHRPRRGLRHRPVRRQRHREAARAAAAPRRPVPPGGRGHRQRHLCQRRPHPRPAPAPLRRRHPPGQMPPPLRRTRQAELTDRDSATPRRIGYNFSTDDKPDCRWGRSASPQAA